MTLLRGSITPVLPPGETLYFEYNPSDFSTTKEAHWAEVAIPGLDFPLQQFVRGGLKTLDLDVYLNRDFYDSRHDVRASIEAFERLVEKSDEKGAPPVCLFHWGRFDFVCVAGSLGVKYTLFDGEGEPLEATLSLVLRQYREKSQGIKTTAGGIALVDRKKPIPVFSGELGSGSVLAHPDEGGIAGAKKLIEKGRTLSHLIEAGDTLQSLAARFLGDPGLWRVIEFANQGRRLAENVLAAGDRLVIPDLANAATIMSSITNFPPQIGQSLGAAQQAYSGAGRLLAAVRP